MQKIAVPARLTLPAELHGGDVPSMFAARGLVAVHDHGESWYVHAAPDRALVSVQNLAGPNMASRFHVVASLVDDVHAEKTLPGVQDYIERRKAQAGPAGQFLSRIEQFRTELAVADPARSRQLVDEHYQFLGSCVDEAGGAKTFPQRSVHVVTASDVLLGRLKFPSILLRIAQDPKAIDELRTGTVQQPTTGLYFSAAAEQWKSLALGGNFLGPLFGCMLPYMWAYPCPRLRSTLVFGLGRAFPAAGTGRQLLELIPHVGPPSNALEPTFAAEAPTQAIVWWVRQLDELFRYLTDPATYVDSKGNYVAYEHQHWMMTIDQVLKLTTSVLSEVHDLTAQRTLALWLLGSFADRLFDKVAGNRLDLKKLCRIDFACEQLKIVEEAMPAAAGQILLPPVRRAIAALKDLQDGFYIAKQRNDPNVLIQLSDGTVKKLSKQDAAAQLLVVHRNATHGFGGLEKPNSERSFEINECLLAQHTGEIPGDIALLPFLYLLVMLTHPGAIREGIIERVAQRG